MLLGISQLCLPLSWPHSQAGSPFESGGGGGKGQPHLNESRGGVFSKGRLGRMVAGRARQGRPTALHTLAKGFYITMETGDAHFTAEVHQLCEAVFLKG